ncbi:hypothetical protein AB0L53_21645 [Nonomuraea sp. NPDC052129]|uniref:hypothetical protein n=1 Tax=Nonomuraea sp. NPDC052129 TaxID=3154651 RepID=UPI003443C763
MRVVSYSQARWSRARRRAGASSPVICHRARPIEPGTRTGSYRTALDDLVIDDGGNSTISVEDYAVALLDEIEKPGHRRQRFAVGY